MHVDPLLPILACASLAVLVIGFALKRVGLPHVVGYLVTGIVLGPDALGVVTDESTLSHLGAIGVVLLLFFVGMEVAPRQLLEGWRVSVLGTLLQILISVAGVWCLAAFLGWSFGRTVLLGFVVSLSSTAVVIPLLRDTGQLQSRLGGNVLGILLVQDVAIIPMLIVLNMLSGTAPSPMTLGLQFVGAVAAIVFLVWVAKRGEIRLGLSRFIGDDRELQVFAGLIICFGLAFLSGVMQLSTALGAFLGGILIASARETHWIHEVLEPFRVVFVAVFFVSVGMLLDLDFVTSHWRLITAFTTVVFLSNTFINALVLHFFDRSWRRSLYGGSLLAPIGEFSFVLASVGKLAGIISDFGFQLTMAVITSSLVLGPPWIMLMRRLAPGGEVPTRAA